MTFATKKNRRLLQVSALSAVFGLLSACATNPPNSTENQTKTSEITQTQTKQDEKPTEAEKSGFATFKPVVPASEFQPKTPMETELKTRIDARWALLVDGDADKAYEMLSEGTRAVTTKKSYRSRVARGAWTGATVVGLTCEADDKCTARVRLTSVAPILSGNQKKPFEISTHLDENWIKEKNEWFFVEKL